MNNKELIDQLKKLQITNENEHAIFSDYKLLRLWIDKAAPLLKYNNEHYVSFMNSANRCVQGISSRTATPCLNNMKSVINRAIIELENDIKSPNLIPQKESIITPDKTIKYPEKITLKWLWEHVPAIYFWSFIGILFFVFSLGIAFSQTKLYKSLTDRATASSNENEKIEIQNK